MTSDAWNVPTWRAIFFPEAAASPFSADLAVLRTLNRPILWLDLDKHQHIRGELHRYSDGAIFAALEGLRQNNAVPGDTEIAFFETPFQTVSAMRHIHPKEWVALEGQITRIDPPQRLLWEAVYNCHRCTAPTKHRLAGETKYRRYVECGTIGEDGEHTGTPNCAGNAKLDEGASTWIPSLTFELGGLPEEAGKDGQIPTVRVRVDGFMTDYVFGGATVRVCGVLRAPKSGDTVEYIHASSVRPETDEDTERGVTAEDRAHLAGFIARAENDLAARLTLSCFGDWVGVEDHKLALLLSMIGGTPIAEAREPITGLLHIVLAGDPSTAKTALMRRCVALVGGAFVPGPMASSAGLLASVSEADKSGRRRVEPGSMVRADRKILAIDEAGRMDAATRGKLHEAMQSGQVIIEKAAWAKFNGRATIMFGLNPKGGRWDREDTNILGQTDFEESLMSRCWYVGLFLDRIDPERDAEIAERILAKHDGERVDGGINDQLLRKYLFLAKRTAAKLSPEARAILKSAYVDFRKKAEGRPDGAVPVTARQLDQWIYVAQAFAKMRLSTVATAADAEATKAVYERMLAQFGGAPDASILNYGSSRTDREVARLLTEELQKAKGEPRSAADLASAIGAPPERVVKMLDWLKERRESGILEPRPGQWRVA